MERIASFSVDHTVLEPGVYVSRSDADEATGCITTTFDLRMTAPNREPVMDTAAVHALEHLGATFLRNDEEWKDRVIYFGPNRVLPGGIRRLRTMRRCRPGDAPVRVRPRFRRGNPWSQARRMRQLPRLRLGTGKMVGAPLRSQHAFLLG